MGEITFKESKMEKNNAPTQVVYKLSDEVIKKLEKILGVPFVSKDTTELQAGFMLGVQFVLSKLREGVNA